MSKLKVAFWLVGAFILLLVVYSQVFATNISIDEWETVNDNMEATLRVDASGQSENEKPDASDQSENEKPDGSSQSESEKPDPINEQSIVPEEEVSQETELELVKQSNKSTPSSTDSELINLNSATLEQLDQLPGIGPSKASAIIDYRMKYGSFHTLEQLMEVKGIGPKIFARMKELITI